MVPVGAVALPISAMRKLSMNHRDTAKLLTKSPRYASMMSLRSASIDLPLAQQLTPKEQRTANRALRRKVKAAVIASMNIARTICARYEIWKRDDEGQKLWVQGRISHFKYVHQRDLPNDDYRYGELMASLNKGFTRLIRECESAVPVQVVTCIV